MFKALLVLFALIGTGMPSRSCKKKGWDCDPCIFQEYLIDECHYIVCLDGVLWQNLRYTEYCQEKWKGFYEDRGKRNARKSKRVPKLYQRKAITAERQAKNAVNKEV